MRPSIYLIALNEAVHENMERGPALYSASAPRRAGGVDHCPRWTNP